MGTTGDDASGTEESGESGEESTSGGVAECHDVDLGNLVPNTAMGDSTDATDDFMPDCAAGNSSDITYAFEAPADDDYFITTVGSDIDTVLSVLDGCEGPVLDCNDDFAGGLSSRMVVPMTAGQEVIIVVDGFNVSGEHTLRIEEACDVGDEYVTDGSLELGEGAAWESTSTNFPSVFCTAGPCSGAFGAGPSDGDWWAWFGGSSADETGTLDQQVEIGGGATVLDFQLLVSSVGDGETGTLEVSLDGIVVLSLDTADLEALEGAGYGQQQVDITDFADGEVHDLSFVGVTTGGVVNMIIDEISISCDGA